MALKDDLRALALEAATEAGQILMTMEAGLISAKSSPTDLISEADKAAELHIFTKLMKARPNDSIIAEEGSVNAGTGTSAPESPSSRRPGAVQLKGGR